MKFVKGISLFFIYPLLLLTVGFYAGVKSVQFFYPGVAQEEKTESSQPAEEEKQMVKEIAEYSEEVSENEVKSTVESMQPAKEVSSNSEKLCVDTEYVLEETDVLTQSVVETAWRLPDKYVGMDREQFMTAMENYEAFPPLAEMERGFVGLEVLSFSRERVVVQMNYQYLQPSQSFYLAVLNNEVVVYLEDRETIYINTGIPLENLPEEIQLSIMQMQFIENEESLYHFLETYSS